MSGDTQTLKQRIYDAVERGRAAATASKDDPTNAIVDEILMLVDTKARGDKLFPKPWRVERCGEQELIVTDANDTKLFYISGDEGDGEDAKPSILFWSEVPADTEYLLDEISGYVERRNRGESE